MFILNPYTAKPNTIIGGVGGTISSKELLAAKLSASFTGTEFTFPPSSIRKFEIIGSDVHAHISQDYKIRNSAFASDASITEFTDLDGRCKRIGDSSFENTSNLGGFSSIGLEHINPFGFRGTPNFNLNIPNCTVFNNSAFSNSLIENISAPVLNAVGIRCFQGSKIKNITAPLLNNITNIEVFQNTSELISINIGGNGACSGDSAFQNSTKLPFIEFNFTSLGFRIFNNNPLATYVYLPYITSMASENLRGLTNCTTITLPSLTTITTKTNTFYGLANCTLIEMKNLRSFGVSSTQGGAFTNLKTGCLIQVHEDLATANSGSADAALVWAKANRNAVVEFYDDLGNYVSTL